MFRFNLQSLIFYPLSSPLYNLGYDVNRCVFVACIAYMVLSAIGRTDCKVHNDDDDDGI